MCQLFDKILDLMILLKQLNISSFPDRFCFNRTAIDLSLTSSNSMCKLKIGFIIRGPSNSVCWCKCKSFLNQQNKACMSLNDSCYCSLRWVHPFLCKGQKYSLRLEPHDHVAYLCLLQTSSSHTVLFHPTQILLHWNGPSNISWISNIRNRSS